MQNLLKVSYSVKMETSEKLRLLSVDGTLQSLEVSVAKLSAAVDRLADRP